MRIFIVLIAAFSAANLIALEDGQSLTNLDYIWIAAFVVSFVAALFVSYISFPVLRSDK